MPRYANNRRYQVGDWWVGRKTGSPAWHRCRYNPATEQTERVSLRQTDFEAACRALDIWFIESHKPEHEPVNNVTLAEILARYYQAHGQHTASAEAARIHSALWLDYWNDATLAELIPPKQREFHAVLKAQGKSESYIQRSIATVQAAVNFAWKNGELAQPIYFVKLPKSSGTPRGRPLDRDEIRALLNAAQAEHLQRYIKTLLATAARPDAVLDLNTQQIDRDRGLIHLNPPGRPQTKKYRPTVRLPKHYGADIIDLQGNIISGNEGRFGSVKTAWKATRRRAGFDSTVTAYSIRHTIARELRANSVPAWEVAAQLGHKMPGLSTTEIYAPYDPAYLVNAVEVINEFYGECVL